MIRSAIFVLGLMIATTADAQPRVAFLALGPLLSTIALPSFAADESKCKLAQVVEWPVQLKGGLPVIEGSINGKKIGVLLDTGSYTSMVTKAAAERLELYTWPRPEFMSGVGGESRLYQTRIDELRIGEAIRQRVPILVGDERPIPGVDLILGDDFFKQLDMEFEYAKGVVRLFQSRNCEGAFLAYWDSKALELPIEGRTKTIVPIKVNGRAANALIDSGAAHSVVALSFAERLGINSQAGQLTPSNCIAGIGADLVQSWVAKFDTLEIGGETIRDSRLPVAEIPDWDQEVILGTDFLRAHRMFVSRTQRKVYLSYIGGLIFSTTPALALECDERLAGKNEVEALVFYDGVLAKNPGDTKARLHRAALRTQRGDTDGTLSDLDAVIRVEPRNAIALSLRSRVRAKLKDYDGALADSSAAIESGMRSPQMFLMRAGFRRSQGDYAHAIEEYDEALKLDPRLQGVLAARGHSNFYVGRYEAAEKDFVTLLALQPSAFDSVWLSLSRDRLGSDGRAALEENLAKLKDDEWPAPILKYLLGRLNPDALVAAAANVEPSKQKNQICEARFYIAARLITLGQNTAARPLLEKARDECPRNYIEYDAALAELKKLQ